MDLLLREYTNIPDDVINYVIMPYTNCCECKRPNRCLTMDRRLWCRSNGCGKKPKIGKNNRLYNEHCKCSTLQRHIESINKLKVKKWKYVNKLF